MSGAASWTLCMSACTDEHTALGRAGRASFERLARARSGGSIAHRALQRIESTTADAALGCAETFDDEPRARARAEVKSSGEHLASLVRSARTRAGGGRLMLWVVGHGHELGARVQVDAATTGRRTARRPFATIDVGGVSMEGASLGSALAGEAIDLLVLQSCAQGAVETLASVFERDAARFVIASATQVPPPCEAIDAWSEGLPDGASEVAVFRAIAAAMRRALIETASGAQGWAATRGFELTLASRDRWRSLSSALERVCSAIRDELSGRERAELWRWIERGSSRAAPRGERVTLDDLCTQIRATRPALAETLTEAIDEVFVARERGGDRARARAATLVANPIIQRTHSEDFCERVGWFTALEGLSAHHGTNT
ncbi:MAG: hypothetical protein U0269_08660 [Polyangiales bacterium]